MDQPSPYLPTLIAFATSLALVPFAIWFANRWGFLDQPSARKVHKRAIPRIGGLAIFAGLLAGGFTAFAQNYLSLQATPGLNAQLLGLLIGCSFAAIVGFVDDLYSISSRYKLVALLFAAAVIASTGATFSVVKLQGDNIVEFRWLAWFLAVLWICGITVAVNFIDGLDGLAAGLVGFAAFVLGLALYLSNETLLGAIALALFGALMGFLVFNKHPAKIFMGDCGSLLIGISIGSLMLMANPRIGSMRAIVLPSLALAIPILDGSLTFFRRHYLQRRSIFSAERGHIHHRLLDRGLRHNQAVWFLYMISLAAVMIGGIALFFDGPAKLAGVSLVIPLLWCAFRFAGSVRTTEMISALREKRSLDRLAKRNRETLEHYQLEFDKADNFGAWWSLACGAAQELDFLRLKLTVQASDGPRLLEWETPNLELLNSEKIFATIPVMDSAEHGGAARAEVDIAVNRTAEIAGARLAVFSRLLTEHSLAKLRIRERLARTKVKPSDPATFLSPIPAPAGEGRFAHLKVAVVHDFLYTYCGAERVLEQIIDVVPHCDVFALFDFLPESQRAFLRNRPVKTSFIQKLPLASTKHRAYLPLMPLAIEQLDVSAYDLVISSSYLAAKGVITGPDQVHVCYCHSPARYAWDLQHQYLRESRLGFGPKGLIARSILHYLRHWDIRSSLGVDHFIANSKFVAKRIQKFYRRQAEVIHPPVNTDGFRVNTEARGEFYLVAGRLVPYKRTDLVVQAFNAMPDRQLVVIGDGPDFEKIQAMAGPNVTMLGYQEQSVMIEKMQQAKALVFAAEEDFGIIPVEALSCGTPVVAYGKGGVTESVIDGEHGVFFEQQTADSIIDAIERFESQLEFGKFEPTQLHSRALQFSSARFAKDFTVALHQAIERHVEEASDQSVSQASVLSDASNGTNASTAIARPHTVNEHASLLPLPQASSEL
jgi:UDP-N-acetylmuramyl pentapeptide phosphotransferase/UDP-N-acetylglucosamine-1-phosphate transferase/glycosyltransferase involved in cell wall biosynthesis